MNRPTFAMIVFSAVYAGLLVIFLFAVPADNTGLTWWLWMLCVVASLSATAVELTLLLFWLGLRLTGRLYRDPYVPLRLSDEDRRRLAEKSPAVAMLMPAHREVATPEDAEAFAKRIVDILCRTPRYAEIFLLFDSPNSEHPNELAAVEKIRASLCRRGRPADVARVHMETYRDKPKKMKNKPGSIDMWLDRYAEKYEYMFVLDADSSLLEPDPSRGETCDPLERLVLTLERHPEIAMVQSAIEVHTDRTLWGWFQSVGARMASRYHGLLYKWLLEGTVPSYGHNILFRVSDFSKHVANTLEYLSHDFLDAADLQTAGRKCIHTYSVLTGEEGESSLLGYLTRDLRWARGNAQWINYCLTKPRLPLGARIYLSIGILCYVWPLLASVLAVTSVFLLGAEVPLISSVHPRAVHLLLGLVLTSLILPRALASRSLREFNGSILIGMLMTPSLMLWQGVLFLFGAFGTKWTMRGSRTAKLDFEHAKGILRMFFPVSLLGLVLWILPGRIGAESVGQLLITTHLMLLIASPLAALVLSYPLPEAGESHEDGQEVTPVCLTGRRAGAGLLTIVFAVLMPMGAERALAGNLVEAVNHSEDTTCAELDNGNVPILAPGDSPPISSFWIVARHPRYEFDADYHLENFADEHGEWEENLQKEYVFGTVTERFTIFDDGLTVVSAIRYAKWWRPRGMTAIGERDTVLDAHFIVVSKKVGPNDYREVLVLYQDGNVRLKPLPRVDQPPRVDDPSVRDNVFGSSVIVGPAPVSDRPFVEISAVQYLRDSDSLEIIYRSGESANLRFDAVTRESTRLEVKVNYATPRGVALVTLRSMYVADDNADMERVAWLDADGRPRDRHVKAFRRARGSEFLFKRDTVSKHNTSAPDIWIGNFKSAAPRRPATLVLLATVTALGILTFALYRFQRAYRLRKHRDATDVPAGADARGMGTSSLSPAEMRQRPGSSPSQENNLVSVPMFFSARNRG